MFKKVIISFLFAIIIFVSSFSNICNAASVKVTKENLTKAFEELVSSDINEDNMDILVEDDVIKITVDNESYNIDYDLTDKPTFSLEIPIEKGMSYEDFKKKTENLGAPIIGYAAVANIQGTGIEDAMAYLMFSYMENISGSYSTEDSYVIVDDLNLQEGVTLEKTDDPKTIYTSEFGDKVMEYVNALYPETQTISDSDEINSYVMTIEKKDVTETSCKLVSKLKVNTDADFSKLNGYYNKVFHNGITKENAIHVITLKVGQKCKIQGINGYQINGDCVEIDRETNEMTAIKVGEASGYFYIGNYATEQEKESFYITVEENTENETLETIILKIKDTDDSDKSNADTETNKENNVQNSTANIQKLPETGEEKNMLLVVLYTVVGICSISLITLLKKRK